MLQWVDEWIRTPGFGGAAAVVAALLAYSGAARERRGADARATEDRWWAQARWASGLIMSDSQAEITVGIEALDHLVAEADVEASRFAQRVYELLIPGDDDAEVIEIVDEDEDEGPHWDHKAQEDEDG